MNTNEEVLLPTTEDALDKFVDDITEQFYLPKGDDTYDMIATAILHLPMTKAYQTKEYFGHTVLKSMANQVAYKKLSEFKAKRESKEQDERDQEKQQEVTPVDVISV